MGLVTRKNTRILETWSGNRKITDKGDVFYILSKLTSIKSDM